MTSRTLYKERVNSKPTQDAQKHALFNRSKIVMELICHRMLASLLTQTSTQPLALMILNGCKQDYTDSSKHCLEKQPILIHWLSLSRVLSIEMRTLAQWQSQRKLKSEMTARINWWTPLTMYTSQSISTSTCGQILTEVKPLSVYLTLLSDSIVACHAYTRTLTLSRKHTWFTTMISST
jgi:hypothetical protein